MNEASKKKEADIDMPAFLRDKMAGKDGDGKTDGKKAGKKPAAKKSKK